MKKQIQQLRVSLFRTAALLAVALIGFSATSGIALAVSTGGQVQFRSIKLSDNGASGGGVTTGVGSGTNVTYRTTFRAATSYNIEGIILDFCAGTGGTPFIGDAACPAMTGFNLGTTPTIDTSNYTYGAPSTTVTGLGSTGDWTADSLNSGQTLRMVNTTTTPVALTAGTDYTFSVSGVTNTSVVGTFYARLITYTDDTGDIQTYDRNAPGTYQDYGGFALSTAQIVEVTAKVQETLTFCVSGTLDTDNQYPATALIPPDECGTTTPPAIIIGHGPNNTLDASQIDKNTVWTLASTNALRGLAIRMHNGNTCGGLSIDGGVSCAIPAVGPGTAALMQKGSAGSATAMFGMFCYDSPLNTIGASDEIPVVGQTLCDPNYNDPAHTTFSSETGSTPTPNDMYFGMDTTTLDDNVTSIFGDIVATSTAPVSNVLNRYDFAATASDTTPAGIYKANLAMIATGTF